MGDNKGSAGLYIPVHLTLLDHPKVFDLADALDLEPDLATMRLIRLWAWAMKHAPDGVLADKPRSIARAAGWTGDPELFTRALLEIGWLDRLDDDQFKMHDWEQYGGKLAVAKAKHADAERASAARKRSRSVHDQPTVRPPRRAAQAPVTRVSADDQLTVITEQPDDQLIVRQESADSDLTVSLKREVEVERETSPPANAGSPPSAAASADGQQLALVPVVALAPPAPVSVQGVIVVAERPEIRPRRPSARPKAAPVYTEEFEEFWAVYPRKEDKGDAFFAYQATTLKQGAAHAEIMTAARHFAAAVAERGTERQFVKYPKTWLGPGQPWRDYLEGAPGPSIAEQIGASYRRQFSPVDNVVAVYQAMGK